MVVVELNVILGLINLKLNEHYRLNREICSIGYGNNLLVAYFVERHLSELVSIKGCTLKLVLKDIRLVKAVKLSVDYL